MSEEKSYTMKEMAERKFELAFDQTFSFSQLYDLKKVKRHINTLWKEKKQLFDYLEKARMYSLLVEKPEVWEEWYEKNKYSIGFPKIDELFKSLKYRECAFCGNPFSEGRVDRIYCGDTCKQYAYNSGKTKKSTTT